MMGIALLQSVKCRRFTPAASVARFDLVCIPGCSHRDYQRILGTATCARADLPAACVVSAFTGLGVLTRLVASLFFSGKPF